MMKVIIEQEWKNYIKNPLLWIGIFVVLLGIFQNLVPFLSIHYVESELEFSDKMVENLLDVDIMDGYLPSTEEQQWEDGYQKIKASFIEAYEFTEKEAQEVIDLLKQKDLTLMELDDYLKEQYSFYNGCWYIKGAAYHKASVEEINTYLKEKMTEHPFSFYFSKKFADFCGLYMGFFATVFLAFLYNRDMKRDLYELLHTKPVSAWEYIGGKVAGGFFMMLFVLGICTLFFGMLCEMVGRKTGFPVNGWDVPVAAIIYIVPNLLMITCIYTMIAILFKNPLPGIPLLLLYLIYSNMGCIGKDGLYGYYGRPLAIMVRFPGQFLETTPPPYTRFNQFFLLVVSLLIFLVSVMVWKRRRVY